MIRTDLRCAHVQILQDAFGDRLEKEAPLARYSAARLGGPADALLAARTSQELIQVVELCWRQHVPFVILGGGSNVLISDAGVRGDPHINVHVHRAHRVGARSSMRKVQAHSLVLRDFLCRQVVHCDVYI